MPLVVESEKRLDAAKSSLESIFEDKVAGEVNEWLKRRGLRVCKYLNGIVSEARTKEVLALFEKASKDKDNSCLTAEAMGKDIVTMGGGWSVAVPDFVVDKVRKSKNKSGYPALIEVTTRTIEVYDENIYNEMEAAATFWEAAVEKDLDLRGWNVSVRVVRSW